MLKNLGLLFGNDAAGYVNNIYTLLTTVALVTASTCDETSEKQTW